MTSQHKKEVTGWSSFCQARQNRRRRTSHLSPEQPRGRCRTKLLGANDRVEFSHSLSSSCRSMSIRRRYEAACSGATMLM